MSDACPEQAAFLAVWSHRPLEPHDSVVEDGMALVEGKVGFSSSNSKSTLEASNSSVYGPAPASTLRGSLSPFSNERHILESKRVTVLQV